ncbi:MAG: biotin transporter BioY, partial [Candidatus Adiutrix sp.]
IRLVIWAALIGAGAWISIPLPAVALSLQTFFVVLVGLVEGPKWGAAAAALYLLAGLLGLPVFAGGTAGPALLLKPSAGFALAFPLVALVSGWGRPPVGQKFKFGRAFIMGLVGHTCMYVFGVIGLIINAKLNLTAAALVVLAFVPGDAIKCAAAAFVASAKLFNRPEN